MINIEEGIRARQAGNQDQALKIFKDLLTREPQNVHLLNNIAVLTQEFGNISEAILFYQRALAIKADFTVALNNLANAYIELSQHNEAIEHLQRLYHLSPSNRTLTQLLSESRFVADWGFETKYDLNSLLINTDDGETIPPFSLMTLVNSPEIISKYTRRWVNTKMLVQSTGVHSVAVNGLESNGRLRVGYFSTDFYSHAVMQLFLGVLSHHDRGRFEIYLFRVRNPRTDGLTALVQKKCDHFIDLSKLSDLEAIRTARAAKLDIAVDLNGFTQGNRASIFFPRLAPVQVNFLGYPGSMQASAYDFIIADKVIIPGELRGFYSEKIIYMPSTYQPNGESRRLPAHATTRHSHGLPDEKIILGCFNSTHKISPSDFSLWIRILKRHPNTHLWLFDGGDTFRKNILNIIKRESLDTNRITFAPRLEVAKHLERHRHLDIFLDTHNYNAHTTASDALWMGVPLVTRPGKTFSSRVASSLLNACNLSTLISSTEEEYVAKCDELISKNHLRQKIRNHLLSERDALPLFKIESYTRNLEQAFSRACNQSF